MPFNPALSSTSTALPFMAIIDVTRIYADLCNQFLGMFCLSALLLVRLISILNKITHEEIHDVLRHITFHMP